MSIIYVREQGVYVKKINQRIIVEKNKQVLADIPVEQVTGLCVIGNIQITTQTLHMLMKEGIDISYFDFSGNLVGRVAAESSKNIYLRLKQYDLYQDIEKRLELARTIVANKIENQIAVIKNFNWKNVEYDYHDDIKLMQETLHTLPQKKTSNEIMGIEGSCSMIYFGCFGHMFKCDIEFNGRNRRPPKDPINIMLSLAYTFLTKEVASALDAESFETYLGFLHGIRYGRKSLALDIVEEFRQPVVDRLVVRMFNKQMIGKLDFETVDGAIVLTEEGFRRFCTEYEKWMKAPISNADSRSFRTVIREQISQLKRAIREEKLYIPYSWGGTDVSDQL